MPDESRDRATWVRLDLLEVTWAVAEAGDAQARGRWLYAMLSGACGRAFTPTDDAERAGMAYGTKLRDEAISYRAAKSGHGKRGADARWHRNAQPMPEHGSAMPEQCKRIATTDRQTDRQTDKTCIQPAHAPEAASPSPGLELATDPSTSPPAPITDSQRWTYEQAQPWAAGIVAAGCKIGPKNWPAWKALIDKHGRDQVLAAAGGVSPEDRWPDKTEKAITMHGTQASSTPQAVSYTHLTLPTNREV